MPETISIPFLEELPHALQGRVTLRIVTAEGEIVRCAGPEDGTRIRNQPRGISVEPGEGRLVFQRDIAGGDTVVLSFDETSAQEVEPFLGAFFAMLEEKLVVDEDMESIQPSSLALLEEVSMYNDTLPSLSAGSSEEEVVEMGLCALAVAASLNRAIYLRYDHVAERCDVVVHVEMDADGRQPRRLPFATDATGEPDDGIVWQAIRGAGDAILEYVPEAARLGDPGSPESLAEREIIAVPVSYGSEGKRVIIGVLLVMDKRANSYSNSVSLGSQETKFATSIASMLGSVLGARKVAELGKELHMAKAIQSQILPDRPAEIAGFDLAGRCINCGAVGGDYFDYLPMRDGRTLVAVADVSGHNLASGMLMVGARSTLRALASQHESPDIVMNELARSLYADLTTTELFITAVVATLSPGERGVQLVNAGHNDTMIYRSATGQVERIRSDSTILGFLPAPVHDVRETQLGDGDVMLLYTDGVVEATNDADEMLGEERLAETLARVASGSADDILEAVYREVEIFSSKTAHDDDVTAVVVKAVTQEQSIK